MYIHLESIYIYTEAYRPYIQCIYLVKYYLNNQNNN